MSVFVQVTLFRISLQQSEKQMTKSAECHGIFSSQGNMRMGRDQLEYLRPKTCYIAFQCGK